jgi:cytidylate kinase
VAEALDYVYLDSGAMYRAVTWSVLQNGADPQDKAASARAAGAAEIFFARDESGQRVFLNGQDVTAAIRTPNVTNNIAPIAANPAVRRVLAEKQKAMGAQGGIVAEGRDMGTVVFKDAELKIYMVASIEERARRRQKELQTKNIAVTLDDLIREIEQRDTSDSNRQHGALKQAEDAVLLDTSTLTLNEQVDFIVKIAKQRGADRA